MVATFDSVRAAAAEHAACPICLDSLASCPGEVGALTFRGRRVEPALYHRSCVGVRAAGGIPQLPRGCSPITRAAVDGFMLMPPICERRRWMQFVDWNGDGSISVNELATAIAAMLPVDEGALERLLREKFKTDGEIFSEVELQNNILPHLEAHAAELTLSAPSTSAPTLSQSSTRAELLAWFRYWDSDGSGTLDAEELRYAVAALFFRSLGESDVETKQAVVEAFLGEARLNDGRQVSKSQFLEQLAPALQANLPGSVALPRVANASSGPPPPTEGSAFKMRLLLATTGAATEVTLPSAAALGDLRREAQQHLSPAGAEPGAIEFFHTGRRLQGEDAVLLTSFEHLPRQGAVVQVLMRSVNEETERIRRMREELAREREALQREREDLQRRRSGSTGSGRLSEGSRVRIRRLQSSPELNGRCARVVNFDSNSGRYIVEMEGVGGRKSFRPEALEPVSASPIDGVSEAIGSFARKSVAQFQVWYATSEPWQWMIIVAVLLLCLWAYAPSGGRYAGARSRGTPQASRREQHNFDAYQGTYEHYDDYDEAGLLTGMSQPTLLLLAAGFGYACWKGIIPIQNLNFWQGMMIWNVVQPLLFGGRRRGAGMGSFGGGFGGLGFGYGGFGGFGRRGFF